MSLGNELKRIRETKKLSLQMAAEEIGISRQYLSMLEKGVRRTASFEIMYNIAKFYGVSLDYLSQFLF